MLTSCVFILQRGCNHTVNQSTIVFIQIIGEFWTFVLLMSKSKASCSLPASQPATSQTTSQPAQPPQPAQASHPTSHQGGEVFGAFGCRNSDARGVEALRLLYIRRANVHVGLLVLLLLANVRPALVGSEGSRVKLGPFLYYGEAKWPHKDKVRPRFFKANFH